MAYPGNPELSPQAQDRVMTAFKQVVGKLQQGNREEAIIGLEFVLRLDPAYAPAKNLHQQLSSGSSEIDLNDVLAQLQAPTTDTINTLLVEAVEMYDERDFEGARERVEQVLLDLPGHEEARFLLSQIEEATKGESQVSQFLQQARDALEKGDSQEAANFVMMAQALDPHHKGIADTIALIDQSGDVSLEQAGFTPEEEAPPKAALTPEEVAPPVDDQPEEVTPPVDEQPEEIGFEPVAESSDLFSAPAGEAPAIETIGAPEFEEVTPGDEPVPGPPPTHVSAAADAGPEAGPAVSSEPYYDDVDVADGLFETGPTMSAGEAEDVAADPSDTLAVIRDLLQKGGTAAAADDYSAAIDAWSRIFLIDHTHEEAKDRIEHIRHAKEELERRIEPMLADARSSHLSGDLEMAEDFARRALELGPNNVEATRLLEAIQRGAHPDSEEALTADSAMPELEDDLFSDEFEATADFGEAVAARPHTVEGEWRTPVKPKKKIPWQWLAAIGVVGIVIVGVAMWFGGFLTPAPEAEPRINVVNRVLSEAEAMYNQKRVEEAILHLEQNSADDPFQVRIDNKLVEYRAAIATPVPTPIPEGLVACREILAEGRWMEAYERAMIELRAHPNDPGLEAVRQQILEVEPLAADLYSARRSADHQKAVDITKRLLEKYPDNPDLMATYDRAALAELRAFKLPNAESYLTKLQQRQPQDEEVQRILDFINTYKSRPVDMQLEIFIGSLSER
jgi:tetratricopeptide (TPR) repeat protein